MGKGQVQVEDLHRALDAEVLRLETGSDWVRWLDLAALLPTYGFGNIVLINLQMPQASWVAGAQMWEKLGRRVRAGQAIRILKPTRSRTAVAVALAAAGRRYGVDGMVEQQVIGFDVGSVYDVTATTGSPIYLPRPPTCSDEAANKALWDGLSSEAAAAGVAVGVGPTGDPSAAMARLVSELGRVRLQSSAGRGDDVGVVERGIREAEVESVAHIVLAHHGLNMQAASFESLAALARLADPKEPASVIKATGSQVINTARQLIKSTDNYLEAHRTVLQPVAARPLDSVFMTPDLDGPVL
ncbi:hypothetical protein ACQPYH_28195 [Kribbella sp. CA-245084]|uniref:hypothetical protein n=1 Tax=Kribbella sp. CA-245084 TaxID=3239940 RepID=UPI003D8CF0BE